MWYWCVWHTPILHVLHCGAMYVCIVELWLHLIVFCLFSWIYLLHTWHYAASRRRQTFHCNSSAQCSRYLTSFCFVYHVFIDIPFLTTLVWADISILSFTHSGSCNLLYALFIFKQVIHTCCLSLHVYVHCIACNCVFLYVPRWLSSNAWASNPPW